MSHAPLSIPIESPTAVANYRGNSTGIALQQAIDGDMLYEVVCGKIVEKDHGCL